MSAKQVTKKNTTEVKNKKVETKEVDSSTKMKRIIGISLFAFIVILIFLIVFASYFRNFGEIRLSKNNNTIFDVSDLVINDLKYLDNENKVKDSLGKPKEEKEETIDNYEYKVLEYNGATIYLKEYYNDYVLCKVEVTSSDYKLSRDLRVGNKITKVFDRFKVENPDGAYMYGNYTNKALTEKENVSNIYFGVRSNENVMYVNRDAIIAGLPSNIAKINFVYKNGKIRSITWSYDIN